MSLLSLLRRDPSGVCQFQSHNFFLLSLAWQGGERRSKMKNGEKFKKIYDFVVCTLDLRVLEHGGFKNLLFKISASCARRGDTF